MPDALDDLKEIYGHIRTDSQLDAVRVAREIRGSSRYVSRFPLIGRIVPEMGDPALRELIAGSYRVIYQILEDHIEVIAVVHGARDFPSFWRRRQ